MQSYSNKGGNSNIVGYESGDRFIKIKFADGSVYEYTTESCGENTLSQMKSFAYSGVGLNGFISRNKPNYASKS